MLKGICYLLLVVSIIAAVYGRYKPLPSGVRVSSETYTVADSDVHFFRDVTYVDSRGTRHSDQEVFGEVFRMINGAHSYVLVDMFLFNDLLGSATTSYRGLSKELTDTLIAKKRENPDMVIQVITDPINRIYGGYISPHEVALRAAHIPVIETDLSRLRDSNPTFSGFWRAILQWMPEELPRILPNILDARKPKLSIEPYLEALNFKANHRKVVLADYERNGRVGMSVFITSANPHDGSSAHSNSAVRIDSALWKDVIATERAVAAFSKEPFVDPPASIKDPKPFSPQTKVQLLTEGAIRDAVLENIQLLQNGDALDMAMFYLSDRAVVKALARADARGVNIRLLLDPNKDAFGRQKDGTPNRQVAYELMSNSTGNTAIRWCDTHGEQCHSKMLIFYFHESQSMLLGSANLTRRNIQDLNLETNVLISGRDVQAIADAAQFFETTWKNSPGKTYSADYSKYGQSSILKTIQYRVMEFTGLSSF